MAAKNKANLASQFHEHIQQPGHLLRLLTKINLPMSFGKHMKEPTLNRRERK
jgi:hypothetical protein